MMLPNSSTEQVLESEIPLLSLPCHIPALFTTRRNPFRASAAPTKGYPPKASTATSESPLSKDSKDPSGSPGKDLPVTLPSVFFSAAVRQEDSKGTGELCVPSVAFPYICGLDEELETDMRRMGEQIPVLSCEVGALAVNLGSPRGARGKSLVLGLDGTLVAIHRKTMTACERVEVRPHALDFLQAVSAKFEVIIFSTETPETTSRIVSMLDPKKLYISHVLDRRHCVERESGVFLKDLRVLGGRTLDRLVAVDSTLLAFMSQIENGILVPLYRHGRDDNELKTVLEFLITLEGASDVRPLVKKFAGIVRALKLFSKEDLRTDLDKGEEEVGAEYE